MELIKGNQYKYTLNNHQLKQGTILTFNGWSEKYAEFTFIENNMIHYANILKQDVRIFLEYYLEPLENKIENKTNIYDIIPYDPYGKKEHETYMKRQRIRQGVERK